MKYKRSSIQQCEKGKHTWEIDSVLVNKGNDIFLWLSAFAAALRSYQSMRSAGSNRKPGLSVFWSGALGEGPRKAWDVWVGHDFCGWYRVTWHRETKQNMCNVITWEKIYVGLYIINHFNPQSNAALITMDLCKIKTMLFFHCILLLKIELWK